MSNISISGCERACVKFGKKGVRLRRGMRLCAHDIKQLLWRESPIRRRGMFPRRTLATPDAQSQCRMRLSLRAHTHTTHLATTTTQNLAETSLPHQGLALILYSWMRSRFRMHSLRTIAWWLKRKPFKWMHCPPLREENRSVRNLILVKFINSSMSSEWVYYLRVCTSHSKTRFIRELGAQMRGWGCGCIMTLWVSML